MYNKVGKLVLTYVLFQQIVSRSDLSVFESMVHLCPSLANSRRITPSKHVQDTYNLPASLSLIARISTLKPN